MNEINVTSAQYQNSYDADGAVVNSQAYIEAVIEGATYKVPVNTGNRHYVAIKAKHDDADDSFTIQDAT